MCSLIGHVVSQPEIETRVTFELNYVSYFHGFCVKYICMLHLCVLSFILTNFLFMTS